MKTLEKPKQNKTNRVKLNQEIIDVLSIISMLNEECGLEFTFDETSMDAKMKQVNKYARYSTKLGLVE